MNTLKTDISDIYHLSPYIFVACVTKDSPNADKWKNINNIVI